MKLLLSISLNPFDTAKSSAPDPDKNTCSDSSITFLASVIGFFIFLIPETAPAFKLSPVIIDASISTSSLFDKTEPFPALKSSESSSILIVASTASTLFPFCFNIE